LDNCVKWCDEPDLEARVRRQIERFGALGRAFHWKLLSHDDRVEDLRRELAAQGFREHFQAALMLLDVDWRGVYSALVSARAAEARRRQRRWLVVEAGSASQPILRQRGLRDIARIHCYIHEPPPG
jgi:hypothetical protein